MHVWINRQLEWTLCDISHNAGEMNLRLDLSRATITKMAIGLALLVSAIGVSWTAGRIAGERTIARLDRNAQASAALHSALLRSELEKYRLVPFALASDPDAVLALETRDPARLRAFDRKLEKLNGAIRAAAIYLIDGNGTTIAASNWNRPNSFVGSNYGFRDYFRHAHAAGAAEQFALGTVSRHPGLYVARRVEAAPGGGVIVIKVEFDSLEHEWRRSEEPAFVTDSRGVVLVTSQPEWRFHTLKPLPAATKQAMRGTLDFGHAPLTPLPFRSAERDGYPMVRAAVKSLPGGLYLPVRIATGTPGWTLHLLSPTQGAVAAAAVAARLATTMVLALLIGGGWFAARRRRRMQRRAQAAIEAKAALEQEVQERTADVRAAHEELRREMEDRKASEARLQETRDQLVQANKLASLGQITAGVAHEIAQPVAAIRSYADNGRAFLDLGRMDDARANLAIIGEMTERIGTITGELRSFSRKTTGQPAPMPLADAVTGALTLLRDRIERQNVSLSVELTEGIMVLAERVRLEQVLVNLIGNALDALRETAAPHISLTTTRGEGDIRITIANNGPPLTQAVEESLFRPFSSSKQDGLGLGLVISRDIIHEFGGDLRFEPQDGSVAFVITLRTL